MNGSVIDPTENDDGWQIERKPTQRIVDCHLKIAAQISYPL
jgi:hypothetical protein